MVEIATKQEVKARPSKIVAGLEADKTNELLIAIAKAIDRKIDTTDAVALVKSGKANTTQKKESKTVKTTDGSPRKAVKEPKESTSSKKVKSSDPKAVKKTVSSSKVSKQSSKESTDSNKVKSKSTSETKEKDKNKEKKKERQKKSTTSKEVPENGDQAAINAASIDQVNDGHRMNGHVVSDDS